MLQCDSSGDMLNAAVHYELESTRALAAAERAVTVEERMRHLERADHYAKLASAQHRRFKLYEFSAHRQ